jgi:type I restriction enzyme R subunit
MTASTSITEETYAEQPALEWLGQGDLRWEFEHGPSLAPGGPAQERAQWDEVLLAGRLRAAVAELNPELPLRVVDEVMTRVYEVQSPVVIDDHAAFHELLTTGVPYAYTDDADIERSGRATIVDFRQPERNDFLAVNQVTVISGTKNRRPDILLFVNGIPLGQIELKNPAAKEATAEAAANQVAHYAQTIPQLYRFVEVVAVSDLFEAHVGTVTTPAEHFAEWKSMDPTEDAGKPALEVLIKGVFEPGRFLEIVENFVLFESDGARTFKVLAKYHQLDAVKRAVEATAEAMTSDGRAGIVWHTQGAGKSYSMVFYVGKLRRDPRFANPTVVAVTDRLDLDDQLEQTFAAQKDLSPAVRHAESIRTALAPSGPCGRDRVHDDPEVPAHRRRANARALGTAERSRDGG